MTTENQRAQLIAATLAALHHRSQANRAARDLTTATEPGHRAALDQEQAEANRAALDQLERAEQLATEHGAGKYARTLAHLRQHLAPTDPGTVPDPVAEAERIAQAAQLEITRQLAPLYRYALEHIAPQLFDRSHPNPEHQNGHELYAVEIGHPTEGPKLDGRETVGVGVSVSHLRTEPGDLIELLTEPAAAVQLAQVHPTSVLAIVVEGWAKNEADERTGHTRLVLITCPFGTMTYARRYEGDEWSEPATTWHPEGERPEGRLADALAQFYAVHMVAAQVLGETDPDKPTEN